MWRHTSNDPLPCPFASPRGSRWQPLQKKDVIHKKRMKKTVGCFTDDTLREIAKNPNAVVYRPTHDIVYEPWTADRVSKCVARIVEKTRSGMTAEDIAGEDAELREFSQKYTVFFRKLTDVAFVADEEHVRTVQRLVELRAMVDAGLVAEREAQARSADIALKNLTSRFPQK